TVDPATRALFPLTATIDGDLVTLENHDGFSIEVMNANLRFDAFRLSARVGPAGAIGDPALVVQTVCGDITLYGPFLRILGLCNPQTDVLLAWGSVMFAPHGGGTQAPPAGVGQVTFAGDAAAVTATVTGSGLRAGEHSLALLLVDPATGAPISLD